MTLTRGIKSLTTSYDRDFPDIPDTDENLSCCVNLESKSDNCYAIVTNFFPVSISLDASITSIGISSNAVIKRIENSKIIGEISIYNAPIIDSQSNIQNMKSCCSKIIVDFENTGKYILEEGPQTFVSKNFDNYHIDFVSEHLFEKEFHISVASISEIADQRGIQHENTFTKCKIYPYGGLFEYGMHPKQMEPCVFRTKHDGRSLSLRVSSLSMLKNIGFDPMEDHPINYKFIGDFSSFHRSSLYDDLRNGKCKIQVQNKNTDETSTYISNAILHKGGTNLITINFLREEP